MSEDKRNPNVADNPNVVDLGSPKVSEQRGGELLHGVRKSALTQTRMLVNSLFENVDDALFDLAEKAETNALQTRYFDGMREVRRKRQLVERLFVDHVRECFKQFADGKLVPPGSSTASAGKSGDSELSLVDDTDLEESLAVTSMSSKAESRHARTLYAVNQRLAVISGGTKVVDGNNPIGPACLCECFRKAMQEVDADINVKLIVYKLFERYVIAGLEPLYDAVNGDLVKAGVLPQLRRRNDARGRRNRRGSEADGSDAPRAQMDDADYPASDEEAAVREQLYATVNELLAQRRQNLQPAGPARNAGSYLSVPDLISALAMLQQQAPPVPAELTAFESNQQSVEQLKAQLHGQIAKVSKDTKAQVSAADEDTIDLVSMLFDYILEDQNLPTQMQALLGRLQIPYLKVAILDRHLFAKPSHPARRLLDQLADAAKGWSKESDRDLRLFNEVKAIVESLLHEFEDDLGLFDRLLERFHEFKAHNDTRAERAEKRTADAIKGKEKLQSARHTASREILSRTRDAELPGLIRNILTRPWANYLVLTLLRQGQDSNEWRSAIRFIDDLIASSRAPASDQERRAIRESLPGIEKTLRHGLATVAFSDNDVRRLMRALGRFYLARMDDGNADADTLRQAESMEASEPVIPESVEEIAQPDEPAPEPAPKLVKDSSPSGQQAQAMKLGCWVEFVDDKGHHERAKLSWISPISGKYLFVNRRGLKVCDMALPEIASRIKNGSLVVLEEVPLFDRALDAIVERLKDGQASNAEGGAASEDVSTGADAKPTHKATSEPDDDADASA